MQNTRPFESLPYTDCSWPWYDWFTAADGLPRQPFHTGRVGRGGRVVKPAAHRVGRQRATLGRAVYG